MDPKNGNNTTRNKSSTIFKDINVIFSLFSYLAQQVINNATFDPIISKKYY